MPVEAVASGLAENTDLNQQEQQSTYTYERADGTVEYAESAEEAIRRCPELARIALNSPELANMMLEVAAEGSTKLKADAKNAEVESVADKQEAPNSVIEVKPEQETHRLTVQTLQEVVVEEPKTITFVKQEQAPESIQAQKAEVIVEAFHDDQKIELDQVVPAQQIHEAEIIDNIQRQHTELQNILEPVETRPVADVKEARDVQIVHTAFETSKPAIKKIAPTPGQEFEQDMPEEKPLQKVAIIEEDTKVNPIAEVDDTYEQAIENVPAEIEDPIIERVPDSQNETISDLLDLLQPAETPELEQSELSTVETYTQLLMADKDFTIAHEEVILTQPTFEEIINDAQESDPLDTLKEVAEKSAEQPLEQTLVELVRVIANGQPETQPELDEQLIVEAESSLQEAVREVQELVKIMYADFAEVEAPMTELTMELVEKLVILVHELGYEQPEQALQELVETKGLEYLLDACKMLSQYDTPEIQYKASGVSYHQVTERLRRLGTQLFGLIMARPITDEV